MKKILKKITAITLSTLFVLSIAACSDGPAEDAGEEFDKVVTDAGNAVEDACEDVKDAANADNKDC